jgi:hypothetical protein
MTQKPVFAHKWRKYFKLRSLFRSRRERSYTRSPLATTFTPHDSSPTFDTLSDMTRRNDKLTTITNSKPFIDAKTRGVLAVVTPFCQLLMKCFLRASCLSIENWDDDFDFSNDNDDNTSCKQRRYGSDAQASRQTRHHRTNQATTSGAGRHKENWDDDFPLDEAGSGRVQASSSRPSTSHSSRNPVAHRKYPIRPLPVPLMNLHVSARPSSSKATENWDDDFVDEGAEGAPESDHASQSSQFKIFYDC